MNDVKNGFAFFIKMNVETDTVREIYLHGLSQLMIFKIIAWLAICAFVGIALLFILFIAALSSGGGIG